MASQLREIAAPFVADPATGVSIRTRLKSLTEGDELLLRTVGEHLGQLAGADLARRVRAGIWHDKDVWAERKRDLTVLSSARWAGAITKSTHDQWGLARRAQYAHIQYLRRGIGTIRHRLSLPLGQRGTRGMPGGYRTRAERFQKTRRLATLEARLAAVEDDYAAGRVSVVRGGKRLLRKRHHLAEACLTEAQWRQQWESARWFLQADGETGKRFGNETIRVTGDGELSIRLPAALAHLANAAHARYILTGTVMFAHRGQEWSDRISVNRAVAYRVHHNPAKGRWYLDASWTRPAAPVVPLQALRKGDVAGVDMNADHLAVWRLDTHGNPLGAPKTFGYNLDGPATRRDAQVRHALARLLHWTANAGVQAIAVENLDFTEAASRERHGRRRRFRQVISGMPTSKLRARLLTMATEADTSVIVVDPAYTSKWGAEHWHKPLTAAHPQATRHHAASVAIGRRALGHRIRRRTAPPHITRAMMPGTGPSRPDQVTADARKPASPAQEHAPDACTRPGQRTRATRRPNTVRGRPPSRTY